MSSSANQLQRVVGLPGAILMGMGSIIGAGVFVSLGLGEQIAGPSVLLALVIAGGVATCNGLSSSVGGQSSGERRNLRIRSPLAFPYLGFTAGWMFLCAKIRFRRYGGSWFRHLLCSRSYDRNRFGHGGRSNGGYPNRDAKKQCRERHHRLRRPAFSPSLLGDWVSFITKQQ